MAYKMKYQGKSSAFPFKSPVKYEKDPKKLIERLSGPKVDPDAPGTPGEPGYEPPVRREDLDEKGKKLYDKLRKK